MLAKADLLISSVLWRNKAQAAVVKMETANELGFFWCCCFCGVSGFCWLFCQSGSWVSWGLFCLFGNFLNFFFQTSVIQYTHSPLPFSHQANAVLVTTHTRPLTSDAHWRLFWKKRVLDIKAEFMCGLPSYLLSPSTGVSFDVATFYDQRVAKSDN